MKREDASLTPEYKTWKITHIDTYDGVKGKECTKCGKWKALAEYSKLKIGVGGLSYNCKECMAVRGREWREANKEKCLERKRKYRKENREKCSEYTRKWREENPNLFKEGKNRRLKLESLLPNNFTQKHLVKTLSDFNVSCALTGSEEFQLDHVIPLNVGHGGRVYGNMIPLRADLNFSKNDNNIFEWFEANRQRFELSQERFDRLIDYLASANAMTVEEYRAYVYWCHENPRNIDEIKTNLEAK